MDNTVTTGAGSGVTSGLKVLKYLFWCIICPLVQFFSPFRRRTLSVSGHLPLVLGVSAYERFDWSSKYSVFWNIPGIPPFRSVSPSVRHSSKYGHPYVCPFSGMSQKSWKIWFGETLSQKVVTCFHPPNWRDVIWSPANIFGLRAGFLS